MTKDKKICKIATHDRIGKKLKVVIDMKGFQKFVSTLAICGILSCELSGTFTGTEYTPPPPRYGLPQLPNYVGTPKPPYTPPPPPSYPAPKKSD